MDKINEKYLEILKETEKLVKSLPVLINEKAKKSSPKVLLKITVKELLTLDKFSKGKYFLIIESSGNILLYSPFLKWL